MTLLKIAWAITGLCAVAVVIQLLYLIWLITEEWWQRWTGMIIRGATRVARRTYRRFGKPPLTRGVVWTVGGVGESVGGECPNCWCGEFATFTPSGGLATGQYAVCQVCYHVWDIWSDPWSITH